ncbi:hypothetical protein ACUN0C_02405 [Faunimonas sp. B44]|uniref:hypothetical protein n=1 Tax=Faunimonas sp. B44 TaxID=3461493 RepID=UPI0040441CDF
MTEEIAVLTGRRQRGLPAADEVAAAARRGEGLLLVPAETPAIRLNGDDGRRYGPERLAELADNAARLEALKEETLQAIDAFSRAQRSFVDLYFRFVAERVSAQAAALEQRLAWAGGLFRADDVLFSALKPLAGVIAAAPGRSGEAVVAAGDFAFWTGRALVLVSLASLGRRPPDSALIVPVTLTAADLSRGPGIFADQRFPAELSAFEAGEAVPRGPFRPRGLSEGVAA